ncbi:MAG: hypothetical protein GY828_06925 [Candidatus Gracilibacteria bacterium]|nr:hypothetical protein [Candidatus Gracilibacteria bacterium]
MKKHTHVCRNVSYWSIFIMANLAVGMSIADVSAAYAMEIIFQNPELAEYSFLTKDNFFSL